MWFYNSDKQSGFDFKQQCAFVQSGSQVRAKVGTVRPLQFRIYPIGISKLISAPKKHATPCGIHVCLCWTAVVGNNSFWNMYVHGKYFAQCDRAHYLIKALILLSRQRRFLRLCIRMLSVTHGSRPHHRYAQHILVLPFGWLTSKFIRTSSKIGCWSAKDRWVRGI
jgi:hypothetical protein